MGIVGLPSIIQLGNDYEIKNAHQGNAADGLQPPLIFVLVSFPAVDADPRLKKQPGEKT